MPDSGWRRQRANGHYLVNEIQNEQLTQPGSSSRITSAGYLPGIGRAK